MGGVSGGEVRCFVYVVGRVRQAGDKHGLTAVSHVNKGSDDRRKRRERSRWSAVRHEVRVGCFVEVVREQLSRGASSVQQRRSARSTRGSTGSKAQGQDVAREQKREPTRTVGVFLRARRVTVVAVVAQVAGKGQEATKEDVTKRRRRRRRRQQVGEKSGRSRSRLG